jgi:hypothetical protein
MKKIVTILLYSAVIIYGADENLSKCASSCSNMQMQGGKVQQLYKINQMPQEMQLKLKFDALVNLPILARTFNKNSKDEELALTKEQRIAIQKYKIETMDTIIPLMESSHNLSKKLKNGILKSTMSEDEALEIVHEIATQKESVLAMKINCILFFKKILSAKQFERLLELDKNMFYLNSPYSY